MHLVRNILAVILLAVAAQSAALAKADDAPPLRVYAAASLADAMKEISEAFKNKTGQSSVLALAATSTLARQIAAGAEASVFISADTRWIDWLGKQGLLDPAKVRVVARNRLVLVTPDGSDSRLDLTQAETWRTLTARGRIAIGDPAHVPAGRYAKAALEKIGCWTVVEAKLAAADNVRNALALVERGEVAAGIVYATDARISKHVSLAGTFPADTHPPIVYPAAPIKRSRHPGARPFLQFLQSTKARGILASHGFIAE